MLDLLFAMTPLVLLTACPVPLYAPFCLLQLALLKSGRGWLLPAISAFILLIGLLFTLETGGLDALLGALPVLFGLLGLFGSGLGWLIQHFTRKHSFSSPRNGIKK